MAIQQVQRGLGLFMLVAILGSCRPDSPSPTEPVTPGSRTFDVTLEWTAPTTDADGDLLQDLAGYSLHYRTSSPADGPGASLLEVTGTTRATVSGLEAGRWYFGVTARDVSGNESNLSNEISVEVGP